MKEEQIEKLLEKWGANKKLSHKKHPLPGLSLPITGLLSIKTGLRKHGAVLMLR